MEDQDAVQAHLADSSLILNFTELSYLIKEVVERVLRMLTLLIMIQIVLFQIWKKLEKN